MLAIPTYTQAEAEYMLAQKIYVPVDAFPQFRIAGRPGNTNLILPGASDIGVLPAVKYQIEVGRWPVADECMYLISGQLDDRPMEGLCSFHIHDLDHMNPTWHDSLYIWGGIPHVHRYNERAVKEEGKWCSCATTLPENQYGSRVPLWHHFVEQMKIQFQDQVSYNACLNWVSE